MLLPKPQRLSVSPAELIIILKNSDPCREYYDYNSFFYITILAAINDNYSSLALPRNVIELVKTSKITNNFSDFIFFSQATISNCL